MGCLDGRVHLIDLQRRVRLRAVSVGAPVARLWSFASAGAAGSTARLLLRSLQGTHIALDLEPPFAHRTLQLSPPPLEAAAPSATRGDRVVDDEGGRGETTVTETTITLSVQYSRSYGQLILMHTSDEQLRVYGPELLVTGGAAFPLFVFALPPRTLPGSAVLSGLYLLCMRSTDRVDAPYAATIRPHPLASSGHPYLPTAGTCPPLAAHPYQLTAGRAPTCALLTPHEVLPDLGVT